ncbi:hypothetical protein [Stenotrophomonas acidaminiphila]|uniref:hypothetical protein n=1 Tax=Stenotrophomonas acidaminiphila TaxID=128780 RepID=UPI003D03BEE1
MDRSVRNARPDVVTLVRMCGRLYAISRRGDRVAVRFIPKRERQRPTRPGVVVPFPGR